MNAAIESRQEIVGRIRQIEPQLREYGVARLALFGSFARGKQHADSDVDLLVEFAPGLKSFDNYIDACELLERTLNRRVELLTAESLSPYIGPHILHEAVDVVVAD
jgi:uncharacterized protein